MHTKPLIKYVASLVLLGWAVPGLGAQAQPPEAASAVQELTGPNKTSLDARNWRLDPAVFTEITPFTAPDVAIELPLEQQEQAPLPSSSAVPIAPPAAREPVAEQ